MSLDLRVKALSCLVVGVARKVCLGAALTAVFVLGMVETVFATTFTTTVPGTSITIPTTYPQAGGVVIVLEGTNGNIYYQFVNPSTMFQGYQNSGTPAAWNGNPFQIGPTMTLNCGPVVSCSSYLGGGITRMSVRFSAYDGDNQVGQFDYNDLNLRFNGSNFGASSGNWSVVPTQNTDVTGTTLISSGTGYGNNTMDTGWFQSTDQTILGGILSGGTITATVFDRDPNDNFWDFQRGNDAVTSVVPLNVAPGVTLNKASTTTSFSTVGQIIPYTFTYANIGSVWINALSVSDPKVAGVVCPAPPVATTANLDPGEQVVCTANYVVKQSDIDTGQISNTATATGTPQAGALGPVSDTNIIPGPASAASVSIVKSATPSPFGVAGSTLTYQFSITNTGNVTLNTVAVSDPSLSSLSCTTPSIAPGVTAVATCTGNTRTITQANVDSGSISNTATVTARAPNGTSVNNTSSITTPGPTRLGSITLVKSAGTVTDLDANGQDAGDQIAYSFVVNNAGSVTLSGIAITDAKVGTVTCPTTTLLPTTSTTCTATYTLTQADMDTGSVSNSASVTSNPPAGVTGPVTDTSGTASNNNTPTVATLTQTPRLFVDKTSPTVDFDAVGDLISYSYLVRNTGTVTITNPITISDNKTTATCPANVAPGLAPNATLTCTATYAATQANIDGNGVTNIASAATTFGAGNTVVTSATDTVTVPSLKLPSLSIAKSATAVAFTNVGDTISYSYLVTNTGNITLTSAITVSDNRIASVTCPALPPGGVPPGGTLTCTSSYSVTLNDLANGQITNTATATSGSTVSAPTSLTVQSGVSPALTVDKSSASSNFSNVGDVISYTYLVTNTGDTTLTRTINITDNKIGTFACWVPPTTGPSADKIFTPAETLSCSANYTVTQADLDAGFVTNQATTATTHGSANVAVSSPADSFTVNANQNPGLNVAKSATTLPVTALGQVLTYTVTATNSGNVTLSNITITDPLIPSMSCTVASLSVGASTNCVGTYTVTQANFNAGQVANTATATATSPQGTPVSKTGTNTVPITQSNSVSIAKAYSSNADEDGSTTISLNDTLTYTITVSNDGNISQNNVVVTDALLTPSSNTCASVLPGASCVLTGVLKVTQAHVDAGSVGNTAGVTTTLLPSLETATRSVLVPQVSSFNIDKQVPTNGDQDSSNSITLNDVLTYSVVVTNTGNVTQTNVTVADAQLSPASAVCASVAPGGTCVLTGTMVVSQSHVDAGQIFNTANVRSTLVTTPVVDSLTTAVAQTSSLAISKALTSNADQDSSASISLNDTLTYVVTATNDGTVTQSNVVVSDVKLTADSTTCATVAPGATCTLTGTHGVTQAEVDLGQVANTGAVTSTLLPTSETVSISTAIPQIRQVSIDKTSSTVNFDAVGDVVSYSYALTNSGNVTLFGAVNVVDSKTTVSCPALPLAGLAPGATHICSASYLARQIDLNAGSVLNTAAATIGTTTSAQDQLSVPALQLPALAVDKTSSTPIYDSVGDVLTYSYLVRNSGNVTLTSAITVSDDKATVTCPALPSGGLDPTQFITCSASYVVTQADIDAGAVVNNATATDGITTSPSDQVSVPALQLPRMTMVKNATAIAFVNVGDVVSYEYVVTNTGNMTLTSPISVTDNRVSTVNCPAMPVGGLAPGAALTCTADYHIVVDDLDIGSVTNVAFASSGSWVSPQTAETIPTGASPALTIVKSSIASSFDNVGDVIPYTFVITNSGNATFTRLINVTDDKIGTIACWAPTVPDLTFVPAETMSCSGNYTVTQADLDSGAVTNQAYASTTYGVANIAVTSPPDGVTVNAVQDPFLTVTKSAMTLPVSAVGQVLTYTVSAENTGDVTLSSVNITDPLIPAMNCTVATLAVGDSTSCVGTYVVSQADFDAGQIANSAVAAAVTPQGASVSGTTTHVVPITQVVSVAIDKTFDSNADEDNSASVSLKDTLTYSVVVTNDGNVTQNNVVIADPLLTPSSSTCASLAPGETCVLTGVLSVTQASVDAGSVANTASVTTTLLPGAETTSLSVPIVQTSALSFDKQVPVNGDQDASGGITLNDQLTYTSIATNTGNVTQTNVTILDALLTPSSTTCASVAPGGTCVLTGIKVVLQADVDAGSVTNSASVTSTLITTPLTDSVTTPVLQTTSLAIAKTVSSNADQDTSGTISLNDTLTYAVTVTNDGSVTQSDVTITDSLLVPSTITCPTLAPAATCVLTGTYTVTQVNVDAGVIGNVASVTSSLLPTAEPVTLNTSITQTPAITVDKTSLTANFDAVGDQLTYSYLITNSGNTTLTGALSVADDKTSVTCPALPLAGLAPGGTLTCSSTYSVVQSDLDAGFVLNAASATIGGTTSPTDEVNITALQLPALTVAKSSPTASYDAVGDVLTYAYDVTNTGNVTLHSAITVSDDKVTVSCPALPIAGLAPTEFITCAATHLVTQSDIDAGSVVNTATASDGATTSLPDSITIPAVQSPAMSVVKNATAVAFTNVGDTVSYEYVVTNTGNTTLTAVMTVSDNRVVSVNCPALPVGGLSPGATLTCTGDYTVVLADLDLGSLTNLAFASSGPTTSPQTSETVPAGSSQALTISKLSTSANFDTVGDVVPYSFTVTNSGTATLTRLIEVVDDKIGTIACYTPTVADPTFTPNESITCGGNYTVTQGDLDAGFVTNQAFAATTFGASNIAVTSAPDDLTVNALQNPALTVAKSATALPVTAVGQVLTYTITAQNTGDITLSNVTITDPLIPTMSCSAATLAVGATASCIGTYTVTQADFDAGQVVNTASAASVTPQGLPVVSTGTLTTAMAAPRPELNLTKTATTAAFAAAGDVISYDFVVTNSGDVTLNNITVTDPLVPSFSCVIPTLAPTMSNNTCNTSFVVTQANIDAGSLTNVASVTADAVRGSDPLTTATETVSGPARVPLVSVRKSALTSTYAAVGDVIDYEYLVSNAGNISLVGAITIVDDKLPSVVCPALPVGGLLPGGSVTCAASHTIVLADLNAGQITNIATANGNTVLGPVSSPADSITVNAVVTPAIAAVKTAGSVVDVDNNGTDAGDTIAYSFAVSNEGNVTLSNVGVSDAKVGAVTCPVTILDPGVSTTCTATYSLTLSDINAGQVTNTAVASGTPPTGPVVTDTSGATPGDDIPTVTSFSGTAAIAVVKSAGAIVDLDANGADIGDTIDYTFTVSNQGNVTLSNVGVTDAMVGIVLCPVISLDPGASTICTATYSLVLADLNAGQITNSATASGTPPTGADVSDNSGNSVADDTPTITPIAQTPAIAVTKSSSPIVDLDANGPDQGDTIDYSFTVSNEGNVTLTSVGVSDPKVGTVLCSTNSLPPATSTSCSATYVLTQADVDSGEVQNSAVASGTPPTGPAVSDISGFGKSDNTATVTTIPQAPALVVTKSSPTSSFDSVGDVINYDYLVQNSGNVTVTNAVTITDDKTTVSCAALPQGGLVPTATLVCAATYSVTQADIDAGAVLNTAHASTTFGSGNTVVDSLDDTATVSAVQSPALNVVKTATSVNFINVGDVVDYDYVVTNTGNTTIVNPISITDNRINTVNCPALPFGGLAPGASLTCTASYNLLVEDLDFGSLTNIATATDGSTTSPSASVTVPSGATPSLTLSKSSPSSRFDALGDTITYNFLLANSGTSTFTRAITVSDDKIGSVACFSPTPADLTFTPGETLTCSANYTVAQADLDRGFVTNEAFAATTFGNANIPITSVPTRLTINAIQNPGFTVSKSAATLPITAINQVVTYTVTATNSGDITLSNVNISDPLIPSMSCTIASLAPGASSACVGTHTVTQSDFDAGSIVNTAAVSGVTPQGVLVTSSAVNTVSFIQTPGVAVVKSAGSIVDRDGNGPDAGDQIDYSFVVSNEGDVTLSGIAIADAKIGTVNCPATSLAPGLSTICTATYVLTLADLNLGSVVNTATVSAQLPLGGSVNDTSGSTVGNDTPTTTSIPANPAIAVVKTAAAIVDVDGNGPDAGDTISYTFNVNNTGNQTITALAISDPKVGGVACPVTSLLPATATDCSATYTLNQGDIDAGSVTNTAIATANDPNGAQISDVSGSDANNDAPTITNIPRSSAMTLVKSAGVLDDRDRNGADVGDILTFDFQINNSGNQTLTNITVSDAKATVTGGPLASLAPQTTDSTTFKATYVLTQADVDTGNMSNTALVQGNPPTGPPVTDTSGTSSTNDTPTDTAVSRAPALTLVKTATAINDRDGNGTDAGDAVTYDFVVQNTGNVTLTDIAINDPLVGVAALEGANDVSTLVALASTGLDTMTTASISNAVAPGNGKQSLATGMSNLLWGVSSIPTIPTALHAKRKAVRLSNRTGSMIAGENVGIYYTVTNTGDGVLTAVSAAQEIGDKLGGTLDELAPNTSDALPLVFAYTLTEQDVKTGYIALPGLVSAMSRDVIVEVPVVDKIMLADISAPTELLVGSITPALIPTLAPGGTTTFSGTYILTQADIDAGTLRNTATVSAAAPGGASTSDISGTSPINDTPTDVSVPRAPAMTLVKSAGTISDLDGNGPDVGDSISYTFDVSNTGNVTLSNVAITDVKVGTVNCPQTVIAPASSISCVANYALTQVDVDAGQVTNSASVSANAPGGGSASDTSGVTASDNAPTIVAVPRNGGVTLVKSASTPTINLGLSATLEDAGDQISYNFTVANTGNVTLNPISVSDAKIPSITCPVSTLLPSESTVCLGVYTLTQSDFDSGVVENTALVSARNPDGSTSTDTSGTDPANDTPTQQTLDAAAAIAVVKSAAAPTIDHGANTSLVDAGDVIAYTFTVANTGNVTLTGIDVSDPQINVVTCVATTLIPGASTTCSGSYTLRQVELDAGSFTNSATVSANSPGGAVASDTSGTDETNNTATVSTIPPVPLIGLVKTASPIGDVDGNGIDAGDTIEYTFSVTNQGNVTLNTISVEDPIDGLSAIVCPVQPLSPATAMSCTATYTLVQADIDRGQVSNRALAKAVSPTGVAVEDQSDPVTPGVGVNNDTITELQQTAGLTVVKTADVSGLTSPAPLPGETIIYNFIVKNTGNVTLTNITLAEDPSLVDINLPAASIATLAPGDSDGTTFRATLAINQADISRGYVDNSAIATGNYTDHNLALKTVSDISGTTDSTEDPTRVPLLATPRISLVKTATYNDVQQPTGANVGDTITYEFEVINTGNVQLNDVNVVDPLFGNPNAITCALTVLDVGERTNCTAAAYVLTQPDINSGGVTNTATANSSAIVDGKTAGVMDVSGTADGNNDPTVTALPIPQPTFSKTVNNGTARIGDSLTFTIKATTVVFAPATIVDQLPGGLSFVEGSASLNGAPLTPTVSGRTLTFTNIAPVEGEILITLRAMVNASAKDGKMTNRASLFHPDGRMIAEARATVEVRPDPVFDCGDIIGKVFDDHNQNGIQDAETSPYEPELGIPNVRVVTVNGTLITTDKQGRFHIPCADIPNKKIGSNFILKLDPRSLPSGYRMTTENPKVVRLTRGKLAKVNFGVAISRVIRLDLTDTVFTAGALSVSPKLRDAVIKLVGILDQEQSTVRLQYHIGREGKAIASRRLKLIEDFISAQWQQQSGRYKLPIETRLVHQDRKASN